MKALIFLGIGFGIGIWMGGGEAAKTIRVQTKTVVAQVNKALQ